MPGIWIRRCGLGLRLAGGSPNLRMMTDGVVSATEPLTIQMSASAYRATRPIRAALSSYASPALDPRPSRSRCVAELGRRRRTAVADGDRAGKGRRALLRGRQDGGLAELVVGLEL